MSPFFIILISCTLASKKYTILPFFAVFGKTLKMTPWWQLNQGEHLDRLICIDLKLESSINNLGLE